MSTITSLSVITTLSVNSLGEIRFQWDGVGETLLQPTAHDLAQSTVSGAAAPAAIAGQPPPSLAGWTAQAPIQLVGGTNPTIEMVLTPPASLPFVFQTGRSLTINFSLRTSTSPPGTSYPFVATTTVDAPYADVVKAVKDLDAPGASGPGIKQDLDFVTGFPLQVYDGTGMPSGGGGGAGASATPTARAIIDAQMKAVLGRSTGSGGVTGTLAALDRSFQPVVSGGVDTWVWQPQSYAVQSDIGAGVTGEQASIARLATTVGDEILPLISGLKPLVPEATVNPDEIQAAISIFSGSWPAVVSELGSDGGPRIPRVTPLLEDASKQLVRLGILLGMYPAGTSLSLVPGQNTNPGFNPANFVNPTNFAAGVGPLFAANWPTPDRQNGVVTNDDEEDYTNFIIACDRVKLVDGQFVALYVAPSGVTGNEDRGFLVTLLQRAVDASGEAADAVYAALDSVNLGTDEREIYYVPGTDPSPPPSYTGPLGSYVGPGSLSIEDIISWAAGFPGGEAASLLQNGGNIGVQSIQTRAGDIQSAVGMLQNWAVSTQPPLPPPGLGHPRVTYALGILSGALGDVQTYAGNAGLGYTEPTNP